MQMYIIKCQDKGTSNLGLETCTSIWQIIEMHSKHSSVTIESKCKVDFEQSLAIMINYKLNYIFSNFVCSLINKRVYVYDVFVIGLPFYQ